MSQSIIKKIKNFLFVVKSSLNHPLNKNMKIKTIFKIISFFFKKRINPKKKIIISWVDNSKFIYTNNDPQLKWNIYHGLSDFEGMMFLLHVLRSDNTFIDVGSNIGTYTVLASKVIGSKSISFEPHPVTFEKLKKNIFLNSIKKSVIAISKGIGSEISKKKFSNFTGDKGPLNRVSTGLKNDNDIDIDFSTLDTEININSEYLIKIDVEGYEYHVLKGGKKILENKKLIGIIIETNSMVKKYGYDNEEVANFMNSFGLFPIKYDPIKRKIEKIKNFEFNKNTIFIKNFKKIELLVKNAKRFQIHTAFNKSL
tara:strand:+ start:1991 stop:2923 length:933 start_codon:yes stop_codon:yes gene_type:complete